MYNKHQQVLIVKIKPGMGDEVLSALADGLGNIEAGLDENVIEEIVFGYQDNFGHTIERQDKVHVTPAWLKGRA